MEYDFELTVHSSGGLVTSSTWTLGERLVVSETRWPVIPRTPLLDTGIIGFTVVSEEMIQPADAYTIGLTVVDRHFPDAAPRRLLYRPFGDPLGAAPGETRVCLRCGGINGEHALPCAGG